MQGISSQKRATGSNAFGMVMDTRSWTAGSGYRYGFNGKEDDPETGTQDYGFRIYNTGLCRFLSVDPLTKDYPWYTPYQFAGNMPIWAIDLDGLEPVLASNNISCGTKDPKYIDPKSGKDFLFGEGTIYPTLDNLERLSGYIDLNTYHYYSWNDETSRYDNSSIDQLQAYVFAKRPIQKPKELSCWEKFDKKYLFWKQYDYFTGSYDGALTAPDAAGVVVQGSFTFYGNGVSPFVGFSRKDGFNVGISGQYGFDPSKTSATLTVAAASGNFTWANFAGPGSGGSVMLGPVGYSYSQGYDWQDNLTGKNKSPFQLHGLTIGSPNSKGISGSANNSFTWLIFR